MAGFLAPAEDLRPAGAMSAFGDPLVGSPTVEDPRAAQDMGDAIIAGLQASSGGLIKRGKVADKVLADDAPWYHRAAYGVGQLAGDVPLMIAGGVAGGVATTAVTANPIAGTIGAGAGAFAAPMAVRDALMQAYGSGQAVSWEDAWDIAKAGLKGGLKGAAIGAVTGGAGAAVGRVVGTTLAPGVGTAITGQTASRVTGTAITGAELGTMVTASSMLEGRMPTSQDFIDNAILLVGVKGAVHVSKGLREIYAQTGKPPAEVVAEAAVNPGLKAEIEAARAGALPEQYGPKALEQRIQASLDADKRPEVIRQLLTDVEKPLKLGEDPIANPVRAEYIVDKETHTGLIRLITEQYGPEIEAQRRGVVPNTETLAAGQRLVDSGKVPATKPGESAAAPEMVARLMILRSATADAYNKVTQLADVPAAELTPLRKLDALAALERLAAVKAEADGVLAEWGRAGQIVGRLKRDPSLLGDAETLLKLAERKGSLQDIAALARSLKDPAQLQAFASEYTKATTTEKVLEAWKAAILSGTQTHLANLLGNATKWAVELPESVLAATFSAVDQAARGNPMNMAQYKARALAPLYGLQMGAGDAVRIAGEVWRQKGESVEKADVYRTAIEGKKGDIIRLPFRLLQVEDVFFRTVAERAEAHVMAVDRAVKAGLHPDTAEFRSRVVEWTAKPELGLPEAAGLKAIERVQQAGAEGVFAQRLGPRMEQLQRAMAGHWSQLIVPFVRTPANLVSWAIQHSPGFMMSGRWREDWAAGGERQARAVSRVVVGTGMAMTAYSLADQGVFSGGGMFDKETARTKAAAGWQPYSVLIDGKWYSYQRIEPVAKVLGLAADLIELSKSPKLDEGDRAKAISMLVLMFGNATISTTYLSGLANTMQSLTDPERYGENFLEQYAKSLVPKIIGQTTEMADPHKREVNGIFDAIQSQIPFLREKLLPKRDVWGEKAKAGRLFDSMPIAMTEQSKDAVRTEAARLQVAIADAPRFVTEAGPFNERDKRVKLTEEQRDVFREVSGKNAMEILTPIVNSPDWNSIPDFAKTAIYKDVLEGTRKQGQYTALPPDAAERQKLREKIVNKVIEQTQRAESSERRVK